MLRERPLPAELFCAGLLDGLKSTQQDGATLLDRTMVLFGTCMSDANTHSNTNLPVLLAGGDFRHGQHLAFDRNRSVRWPIST